MAVRPDQLARALTQRARREREEWGRRADTCRLGIRRLLEAEAARGNLERAWLVGSLAWGGFGVGSDADVVVAGVDRARSAALWDALNAIPGGVAVDLLRIEDLAPDFAARVRAEGVPLVP